VKRLWNVFVLTLALNFLAVAVAAGYLYSDGRIDRKRVDAIRLLLYPPPATQPAASQPADGHELGPVLRLGELLEHKSGLSANEQLQFLQQTFDARMAELDRRQRELGDLQRQVDMANSTLARDRAALEAEKKQVADREQLAAKLAADQGFQDSLELYKTMPPKQVKQSFMSMDDETVKRYLQAMEPRGAAKIVKEFKTPDELARIQRVIDQMRGVRPALQRTADSTGATSQAPSIVPGPAARQPSADSEGN
jgi:flagellar motility protein MotE (MotC chaperone)